MDNLVERLDDFIRRVESIAQSNMTPSAQTSALALLVSMKGYPIAIDCRDALTSTSKALSTGGEEGAHEETCVECWPCAVAAVARALASTKDTKKGSDA